MFWAKHSRVHLLNSFLRLHNKRAHTTWREKTCFFFFFFFLLPVFLQILLFSSLGFVIKMWNCNWGVLFLTVWGGVLANGFWTLMDFIKKLGDPNIFRPMPGYSIYKWLTIFNTKNRLVSIILTKRGTMDSSGILVAQPNNVQGNPSYKGGQWDPSHGGGILLSKGSCQTCP